MSAGCEVVNEGNSRIELSNERDAHRLPLARIVNTLSAEPLALQNAVTEEGLSRPQAAAARRSRCTRSRIGRRMRYWADSYFFSLIVSVVVSAQGASGPNCANCPGSATGWPQLDSMIFSAYTPGRGANVQSSIRM